MAKLKMKNQFIFWIALWIFPVLVEVRGQNSNTAGSSCGGVLELSSGVLDFSPVGQDFCMWVIKLPLNSQKIQFQLTQIPEGSKLNLYSQDGHVAGQISILPIASLTNADVNSIIDTNSSSLIAIWTPSSVKDENQKDESSDLLSFTWDESTAQSHSQTGEEGIRSRDLNLVGGVSYIDADRGRFSWVKPGKSQQTLLWALNSKSSAADSNSLDLKIETDFEKCDLADPCLCSYFGVYEVYENSLRSVSTECSRSLNLQVTGIRPRLVALGFVNPEFRRDTNHVTLSWKGEKPEEGTTTTTSTTQTTTEITTTEAPTTTTQATEITTEEPTTCSSGFPQSCSEIQFESASNSSELQNCIIFPDGPDGDSLEVLCDFETDGGGWTIFQKRSTGPKEEFKQNWSNYTQGFGSLDENFWIGLENIHALTQNGDQELRIQLEDFEGNKKYAKYSNFSISDASDFYRLTIGGFFGDSTLQDSMILNNGQRFTTIDKDNDNSSKVNCAVYFGSGGGWWFDGDCLYSNLNGLYFEKEETVPSRQGIFWWSWKGFEYSYAKSEMKIRKRKS